MGKQNILAVLVAVIASLFISVNASAQSSDDCLMAQYLKISAKVGNGPFTEVMKDGVATYYRRTGWYMGLNGGINALKVNGENSINPTGAISVGHEFKHWHAEFRGGATQFEYLGNKKIGLVTDLGVYYDFFPAKGRNWNIYAGVFAGYQHIKFKYVIEDCNTTVEIPYKGNSFRYGAELGITKQIHYTNSIGVYGRVFSYKYNAGEKEYNPVVCEVGLKLTFGLNRKVRL